MVAQLSRFLGFFALVVAFTAPAVAQDPDYILIMRYETSSEKLGDLGSSSSRGSAALTERILTQADEQLEIEYAIPGDPGEIRGNAMWMYPARVAIAPDGSKTLLNSAELDARVEQWLAEAQWPREACGRWLFTWTAFQILCDPDDVLAEVEAQEMRLRQYDAGFATWLALISAPVALEKAGMWGDLRVFTGTAPIGRADLLENQIQSELGRAEIFGEALSEEEARAKLSGFDASGTYTVELEVDASGLVWARTERFEMLLTGLEDGDERRTGTTVTTRRSFEDWTASQRD